MTSAGIKTDCIPFLQWALPQLNLRWAGFRKVHKQVCKRINRRLKTIDIKSYSDYQDWLSEHPAEWKVLDGMCRITISRFYRDWGVFDFLKEKLLPQMAQQATHAKRPIRIWSAGCASGEEPYTLSLISHFALQKKFPELDFQIIATDVDAQLLERAKVACYSKGSLKGLPEEWLTHAFSKMDENYCIDPQFGENIQWIQQDIRKTLPAGPFDLILCRNLVATYFSTDLQITTFQRIESILRPGGYLVLGCHEKLPVGLTGFTLEIEKLRLYQLTEKNHALP